MTIFPLRLSAKYDSFWLFEFFLFVFFVLPRCEIAKWEMCNNRDLWRPIGATYTKNCNGNEQFKFSLWCCVLALGCWVNGFSFLELLLLSRSICLLCIFVVCPHWFSFIFQMAFILFLSHCGVCILSLWTNSFFLFCFFYSHT